jgi:hypothetical protein
MHRLPKQGTDIVKGGFFIAETALKTWKYACPKPDKTVSNRIYTCLKPDKTISACIQACPKPDKTISNRIQAW